MSLFRNVLANFSTPVRLQTVETTTYRGVLKKTFTDSDTFNCSWKGKGGTEVVSNDVVVVKNTAEITCWYNPNIKENCRLINLTNNEIYEIKGKVENVDNLNQFMTFKVEKISGGA